MNKVVNVLIVDDDYHFNESLSYHLRHIGGYNPSSAFTAEEFKEAVLKEDIDIIILDIRLPDRQGALINPWGGLRALNEMLSRSDISDNKKKCLSKVIIRSVQSEEVARRIGETIPPHHCWLPVDAPFSEFMGALNELRSQIQKA